MADLEIYKGGFKINHALLAKKDVIDLEATVRFLDCISVVATTIKAAIQPGTLI